MTRAIKLDLTPRQARLLLLQLHSMTVVVRGVGEARLWERMHDALFAALHPDAAPYPRPNGGRQ